MNAQIFYLLSILFSLNLAGCPVNDNSDALSAAFHHEQMGQWQQAAVRWCPGRQSGHPFFDFIDNTKNKMKKEYSFITPDVWLKPGSRLGNCMGSAGLRFLHIHSYHGLNGRRKEWPKKTCNES